MKTTDHFKRTIQDYLDKRIANDKLFAKSYSKPGKNIDDCITYILNSVKKSGCNGFTDDEIFGMAIHYYDEENIKVGNPIETHIVVNHTVELTEEEKEQARKEAIKKAHDEAYAKMKEPKRKTKNTPVTNEPTLFDL